MIYEVMLVCVVKSLYFGPVLRYDVFLSEMSNLSRTYAYF